MSPNKTKKGAVAIRDSSPEPGPSTSKRHRSKMSSEDEEDAAPRKNAPSKYISHLRSPSFSSHNRPAELFRKDLISAMKLADSDQLQEGSYFLISDPWRQEWEKGVQVPVNMAEILHADIREIREKSKAGDFKIPHKLLHERADDTYKKGIHELTGMQQLAEQLVRYDLDDLDVCWLEEVNLSRLELGLVQINEWNMERVMEALEYQCHEKMNALMKTEEGLGIEYDEDVVCDVCRSPESEDTNEMVFCDGCDVCIHQACYGIQAIPEGSWLCRTCALGIKPRCLLCPKSGGAMKSTRSGTKWAHVSCALWIPEVSIGIPEKMEPITKISNIPPSRWALLCCVCKDRVGACIQCSVKTCKTAFHVTCGFSENLEMKTVLDETDENDGVKLKAYCPKHTKRRERGHSESDVDSPRRSDGPPTPKKELTQQEKANLRAKKLKQLEEEFYSVVEVSEVAAALQLEEEIVNIVYTYWKLKRKNNWDKPLLTPKTEEADMLEKQQEDSLVARMKMFVHLRQDLERVRNLCYMIGKREKMKRQFFKCREYVFTSMVRVLIDKTLTLTDGDVNEVIANLHFDSFYDNYGLGVHDLPAEDSEAESSSMEVVKNEKKKSSTQSMETERRKSKWKKTADALALLDTTTKQVDVTDGANESAVQDAKEAASAEDASMEVDEESQKMLSRGERWSGEFVRSGFFKRRRHRKPDALIRKKKMSRVAPSGATSISHSSVKQEPTETETTDIEDSVFNEDSEMDTLSRDRTVSAQESSFPDPIPKLVISPKGKGFPHRRHWHRKRHRGRKPWHVQKSQTQDLAAKIDLGADDEPERTGGQSEPVVDTPVVKEEDSMPPEAPKSSEVHKEFSKESSSCTIEPILVKLERETSPSLRQGAAETNPSGLSKQAEGAVEVSDASVSVQADEDVDDVKIETDNSLSSPAKPERTEGERTRKRFEKAKSPLAEKQEESDTSRVGLERHHRRKSSLQTRLKLNKVMSKLDESSDDDFEPAKPLPATYSRKQHLRQSKRQGSLPRSRSLLLRRHESEEEASDDEEEQEEEEDEKVENRLSRHPRHGRGGSEKSSLRPYTATIRPELNGLLRTSKLRVKESVKERVQNRLLKSRGRWRISSNGLYDKQQTLDSLFNKRDMIKSGKCSADEFEKKVSESKPSSRVLHEITPEKSHNLDNNIFGAHYTPRGSLSGYKIPKKSSQSPSLSTPTSPLQNSAPSGTFGGSGEHRSFRSEALSDSPRLRPKIEGVVEEKAPAKKSQHLPDDEKFPLSHGDHCDASQLTVEAVSNCQGYRSPSPMSSEGSHAFHSDSRESTPRRFTRSQLADDFVENTLSPRATNSSSGGSVTKMKLRDGWLKAAHFSS